MSACLIEEEEGALGGLFHLAEKVCGTSAVPKLYVFVSELHANPCLILH